MTSPLPPDKPVRKAQTASQSAAGPNMASGSADRDNAEKRSLGPQRESLVEESLAPLANEDASTAAPEFQLAAMELEQARLHIEAGLEMIKGNRDYARRTVYVELIAIGSFVVVGIMSLLALTKIGLFGEGALASSVVAFIIGCAIQMATSTGWISRLVLASGK